MYLEYGVLIYSTSMSDCVAVRNSCKSRAKACATFCSSATFFDPDTI